MVPLSLHSYLVSVAMLSSGQYSLDLMTRVLSGLGPFVARFGPSHEEPAPSLEDVYAQPPPPTQPPLTSSDVVNTCVHPSIPAASLPSLTLH